MIEIAEIERDRNSDSRNAILRTVNTTNVLNQGAKILGLRVILSPPRNLVFFSVGTVAEKVCLP